MVGEAAGGTGACFWVMRADRKLRHLQLVSGRRAAADKPFGGSEQKGQRPGGLTGQ